MEHQKFVKALQEAGCDVSAIVYWNLVGDELAKLVAITEAGMAIVSG